LLLKEKEEETGLIIQFSDNYMEEEEEVELIS